MYRDPADPRLFIPKRLGWGLTVNLAHPAGWWVVIGMVVIPLVVVVVAVLTSI